MAVTGYLEHQLTGRARLRFPARRGNDAFFKRLSQCLRACPGVRDIRCNARTGSVLVLHDERTSLENILKFAQSQELFQPAASSEYAADVPQSLSEIADEGLRAFDQGLSRAGYSRQELFSIDWLALAGMGARHLASAHPMAPVITLLWRSLEVIRIIVPKRS